MHQEKHIIESLLFVNEGPLLIEQIKDILDHLEPTDIRGLLLELKREYQQNKRGMHIAEIAGGFQMVTNPEFSAYLKKYYKQKHKERLSSPALETLAIIAYKQPITRLDIESIRGVNIDGVIRHLLDKGLVRIVGRKEVIGRPFVYGTSRQFLEYFGLESVRSLPKMEEFSSLVPQVDKQESSEKDKTTDETQDQNLETSDNTKEE